MESVPLSLLSLKPQALSIHLQQHPAGWLGRPFRLEVIAREKHSGFDTKGKPMASPYPEIPAVFIQMVATKGYDDKRDDYYVIEMTPDEAVQIGMALIQEAQQSIISFGVPA